MLPHRVINATAPIRICDNGGWTDTWVARHGKVFNIAVRPLVTVRIDVFPSRSRDAPVVLDVQNRGTKGTHPISTRRAGGRIRCWKQRFARSGRLAMRTSR